MKFEVFFYLEYGRGDIVWRLFISWHYNPWMDLMEFFTIHDIPFLAHRLFCIRFITVRPLAFLLIPVNLWTQIIVVVDFMALIFYIHGACVFFLVPN